MEYWDFSANYAMSTSNKYLRAIVPYRVVMKYPNGFIYLFGENVKEIGIIDASGGPNSFFSFLSFVFRGVEKQNVFCDR